jgi:phage tail sheath gpL-like
MPISFNNIPANWKQPLYWVEVDPSMAGIPISHQRALLVGTMMTTQTDTTLNGTAPPDVPLIIGRQMDADQSFGQGSELANMFKAYFKNNFANEVWALPLAEATGAAAATGSVTINSAATEAGTISLYVAGTLVRVNVIPSQSVNDVATALADGINAAPDLPCTAVAAAAVVTITAKWKGILGNEITLQDSYYGKIGGEELPVGMTLTYSGYQFTGGTGTPDPTNAIANLGEVEFDYVAQPYTDSATLSQWDYEYGFSDNGRWGWMRQLFGSVYSAKRGTYSDLITWGLTMNSPVISVLGIESLCPSPTYEISAAYASKAARAFINDPARPLQSLHIEGMLPAPLHQRFNLLELNALATTGVATQRTVQGDNIPMIARETTTYQVNDYGYSDDAYELVTTLATLAQLIRNQRSAITSKYPRHKLADDGTLFGPGQAIVTPSIIKSELITEYAIDMWNGLVENLQAFKQNLIVERNADDPNRLDVLYPPDLINQLRIFAVLAQFRLQYNRGIDTAIIGNTLSGQLS